MGFGRTARKKKGEERVQGDLEKRGDKTSTILVCKA